MSKEDSFGFTHLEEEDDGDEVADIGNCHLDVNLQPHLPSPEHRNSAEVRVQHLSQENGWQNSAMQGINNPAMDLGDGDDKEMYGVRNANGIDDTQGKTMQGNNLERNGVHDSQKNSSHTSNGGDPSATQSHSSQIQVQYSNVDGRVNVMQGHVATRPDGSHYIDTRGIPEQWSELERPLRQRRIKFLKIFSIAACVFFFPLGIPAVYYAFKTETKFNEGIMRGNIDTAQKYAKRSERFIIMSFIMFIVVAALVVAVIERPYFSDDSIHRGTVVG